MSHLSRSRVIVFFISVFVCGFGFRAAPGPNTGGLHPPAKAPAAPPAPFTPGLMPFLFVENNGQFGDGIRFQANSSHGRINLTAGEIRYELGAGGRTPQAFRVVYEGAKADVSIVGAEASEARFNYFVGSNPERWVKGARAYGRIVYRGLYPGIDLHFLGDASRLKCEYHVAAGGDVNAIRWRYRDGKTAVVNGEGQLEVRGDHGVLTENVPRSYQLVDGREVTVETSYKITDEGSAGLTVGAYDHGRELVIDPDLLYASFLGGGNSDAAHAVAVNGGGSVYVAGSTTSTNFPATTGAYDTGANGLGDAFVAKFNAAGTALVYATYIGGSAADSALGLAVEGSGNVVLTGTTESANFPTTAGAFDRSQNGGADVFAAKLNSAGNSLVYSTFLGGSGDESGASLALDGAGNAFLAGATASANYPTTAGAYDTTYNGTPNDAFLSRLSDSGTTLLYSTFIGGSQDDAARAVAVDGEGNAYLTGYTESTNFPTTAGAYDRTKSLYQDVFAAKLDPEGAGLIYSTFIGGSQDDAGNALALDAGGNAYITGSTQSNNYPTTAGAYDTTFNGSADAYITKLNAAGSALSFSTFLGGAGADSGNGLVASNSGVACVIGQTGSSDFPTTADAFRRNLGGSADAFFAKLDAAGTAALYSTYLGGTAADYGTAAASDRSGNVYVAGYTSSSDFPATAGAYDTTYNSSQDAFLAALSAGLTSLAVPMIAVGDFDGDGTNEIAVDFGPDGVSVWDSGAWTSISPDNPESLVAGNFAGLTHDQIAADFGTAGLKIWNGAAWGVITAQNAQRLTAADTDGNGRPDLVGDFGTLGLWLWKAGAWSQLSGADADAMIAANLDGSADDEVVADFGAAGLWQWNSGSWSQLSGADADAVIAGDIDGNGLQEVIGDFGGLGLWLKTAMGWVGASSADADFMVAADLNGGGTEEILAAFGALGTWQGTIYVWTKLSPADGSDMARANTDGNNDQEVAVDFGALGLWLRNGTQWSQLSSQNPESITAGDLDADGADELAVDFGSLGLWLWNAGAWTRISVLNPD